ncbi:MAG: RIP metalloprotease RseP [Bacteroidales bacterium]|nr:RIP metalloprotease RseP [Bacteroidales bacterium]
MEIVIKILQLLLSLSILIILHEGGHFLFARLFKTRVEKFYLFFNPWFSLFKIKKGDTEYGIGWLPLGGYVKISGMIDESMDKEAMKQPPKAYEFRAKPAWQRLLIMLGGVLVNLILGFLIYSAVLFTWGEKYLPNENIKDGIWVTDSLLVDMGLQSGDKVISIDNEPVEKYSDIMANMLNGGSMVIERNNERKTINLPENFAGQLVENKSRLVVYPRVPFYIKSIPDSSVNSNSGLQAKDKVISIAGEEIQYYDQAIPLLKNHNGDTINMQVERESGINDLNVYVTDNGKIQVEVAILRPSDLNKLGIYEYKTETYGLFESIPAGFNKAWSTLASYIEQFKLILQPKTGAYKGLGGFGTIMSLFSASWDWQSFWELTAFLSLILAFMNILPIPALDGGHVMFLLYEIIAGRKPNEKFMEYAQMIGMILLLGLLLYANGMDILRGCS